MMPLMIRMALVSVVLLAGCGKSFDDTPATDGGGGGDAPGVTPDAFVPPAGFTRLIGRTWTLPAGATDTYRCARFTVPEDTYLTNIIAQAPFGTHHTVLSLSDGGTAGPDGDYNCNVSELGMVMLYASGVGTSPLDFPSGVGVQIAAGTQIHLNLHLFNATDQPISGDSAILVKSQATAPAMLAEMVFAGTSLIAIPSTNQPHDVTGQCPQPVAQPFTLFAVWPHMHQIAIHQKVEHIHNGTATVLHDMPYDFEEQTYYMQTPEVEVAAGDQIRVTCTYRNNTGGFVTFGESSNQEMCFTGLYRYPARNAGLFECASGPGL